jgi:hypothetical protein
MIMGIPMVIEHIIPLVSGGSSTSDNLCLAWYRRDEFKGSRTEAADPRDGKLTWLLAAAGTRRIGRHGVQYRQAAWTADSATLIYSQGARPKPHKNLAIAEWPTHSGPADYVLFVGLTPVAVVDAKRQNIDVSAALQ